MKDLAIMTALAYESMVNIQLTTIKVVIAATGCKNDISALEESIKETTKLINKFRDCIISGELR